MQQHEIAEKEILKIDELCDKYPFTKAIVLDFAAGAGADAAIYLMGEIIEENDVRKQKDMGPIAYAATFRQRARMQKEDLRERMAKQKEAVNQEAEKERMALHAQAVNQAWDSGYNPKDYKNLTSQIAQMGVDGKASEGDVSLGLQFISSLHS